MKWPIGSRLLASTRSKLFAAISSVAAIALFAIFLPAAATAGPGASTSTLQDGGVLRLHLGAQDNLKLQLPDGAGGYAAASKTQSIGTSSGCKLALSGDALVGFTPPTGGSPSPYAGFFGDSIGVGQNGGEGSGQPCSRIDGSQKLTMNLGTQLSGKFIDYAEIDVELKQGATVVVTGFLVNGSTATPVGAPAEYSSVGSDSGPDSGDGDNYRIRFPKTGTTTVNRLEFTVKNGVGGASLEGGADGTTACDQTDPAECGAPTNFSLGAQKLGGTTDTLFHLINADGVLACGDNVQQTGGGITTTLDRLPDAGGSTCTDEVPIPYNQDSFIGQCAGGSLNQCIVFQKDLLGQNAQFFWTVTWAPESGKYMEDATQFDFGAGYVDLKLCRADGAAGGALDGFPDLPANGDPWCVVNTATVMHKDANGNFDGLVVVTEKYFGQNDPGGARHN